MASLYADMSHFANLWADNGIQGGFLIKQNANNVLSNLIKLTFKSLLIQTL